MRSQLTAERLRDVLEYNQETGEFIRRHSFGSCKAGETTGTCNGKGYINISVDGVPYRAHRLAWLYVTGEWPIAEIDHINGIREDNRFCNLRQATSAENAQNRKAHRNSKTKALGVSLHKSTGTWRMSLSAKGLGRLVGYFKTQEEAIEAYKKAKQALHAFCPNIRQSLEPSQLVA